LELQLPQRILLWLIRAVVVMLALETAEAAHRNSHKLPLYWGLKLDTQRRGSTVGQKLGLRLEAQIAAELLGSQG